MRRLSSDSDASLPRPDPRRGYSYTRHGPSASTPLAARDPQQHFIPSPTNRVRRRRSYYQDYNAPHDAVDHMSPSSPSLHRSRQSQHFSIGKRPSWPPRPFVEDELVSLRRESNSKQLLQEIAQDEAPSRGSIDQEPLIADIPEMTNRLDNRFVWLDQNRPNTGVPTPLTSEEEPSRKVRQKPSRLKINRVDNVPEISSRISSPYSFSRPSELQRNPSSPDICCHTDDVTHPPAGNPISKSPLVDTNRAKISNNFDVNDFRANNTIDDSIHEIRPAYDDSIHESRPAYDDSIHERRPAYDDSIHESRPAYGKGKRLADNPLAESPWTSGLNIDSLAGSAPPIRKTYLDARRNTDTQNTMPTLGSLEVDKARRPAPFTAYSSSGDARGRSLLNLPPIDSYPRLREPSYLLSRRPSPIRTANNGSASPSYSNRPSPDLSYSGNTLESRPTSAASSRPASTSSRPISPSFRSPAESPRLARTDLDCSTLLNATAANPSRRMKPPSRLATALPELVAEATTQTTQREHMTQSGSLPYPEDDSFMRSSVSMPEEQDHAYYPSKEADWPPPPVRPPVSSVRPVSPASSISSRTSTRPTRPIVNRGYSTNSTATNDSRSAEAQIPKSPKPKRAESFATSSEARKELAILMTKGLPPCSRPEPVAGYDDWYSITGAINIYFCPNCIHTLFERTAFRAHFRRSLPRDLSAKVSCAFASPWVRLAWLLTLQQQRTDLILLKELAAIEETTEGCPGSVEVMQSWYCLRDHDGLFVRDFHVCFCDVRKIEHLLPKLAGMFVKLPLRASYEKRICAMRTDSNRFSEYLESLVTIHEKASASRKAADPMSFIELVERKTRLRECTRDNMLIGGLWHFMPEVPSFTVCEDCFESIVEPEIRNGFSVAKRFNRTVQPVYGEGIGSSCQLYSRRMRRVFRRAVDNADLKYLTRRSKERREAELWLQDRYRDVIKMAKRLGLEGGVNDEMERRFTKDLEKISTEWKTNWE